VVIVNWNYGKRDESLKFFADRGHKQVIAGYYDGSQDTKKWLESAGKVEGVVESCIRPGGTITANRGVCGEVGPKK